MAAVFEPASVRALYVDDKKKKKSQFPVLCIDEMRQYDHDYD